MKNSYKELLLQREIVVVRLERAQLENDSYMIEAFTECLASIDYVLNLYVSTLENKDQDHGN